MSSGGSELHHIEKMKGPSMGEDTREGIVRRIDNRIDSFFCDGDDGSEANCVTVHDRNGSYVKTKPDKSRRDNLLALPRY